MSCVTHTRIYLVGFMGAGKSSIGRLLARRLGWKFVDLDREIEHGEKQTIPEIFSQFGEPRLRQLETTYLRRVSTQHQIVTALGGGTFVDPANRELSCTSGLTVWLKVSFATVVTRVKMDGTRPRFGNKEQAEALYHSRDAVYREARLHIDADKGTPAAVADEILGVIRKL